MRSPVALTAVFTAAAAIAVAAQEPQPAARAFRLAVDVVPVDVSVIGDGGRPVTGLAAGDFFLTVDGKPRRVASAEFIAAPTAADAAAAPSRGYSTNAGSGGRLILILVDQGSISRGRGRTLIESVSRFIGRLAPADRVGLAAFPGAGAQLDFTQDHAAVQAALSRVSGQADTFESVYRIGVAEAFAAQTGDRTALNTVVQRECGLANSADELEICRTRIVADMAGMMSLLRERTQNSMSAMKQVMERLAAVPGLKTVVYVSEGLVLERPSDANWLAPAGARAQVAIQVLHLDAAVADASKARESITAGRDRELAREGLGVVAGMTRGGLFTVQSSAEAALNRLALELSGYYLLGFEPEPGDRDGKPHKIKVDVPGRSGTEIRARAEFSVNDLEEKTEEAALLETMKSPLPAVEIGLKLTAFTLRDPESDKLRVLMVSEIDRSANPDGRLALAYTMADDKGRLVASHLDRDVKAPVHPTTKTQRYTTFILGDATGRHTLKLAVVDDRGRRGSLEHPVDIALTTAGRFRVADLLLADERLEGGAAAPAVGGELTSGILNSYLEIYADAETLKNASVFFEVAESADGRALDGAAGRVQPATAESPNRRAMEGSIPTALLPPGDYVARAVVSANGQRIGQVARSFRVGKPSEITTRTTPTIGLRSRAVRTAPVVVASRPERFDRGLVLTPDVVGFFVDRLNFAERGEANAAPAIEHAKAGRFDDAVQSLTTRSGTVPAAFLSGLALYSKGELEAAAAKFREALRLDSEFFAAAFYLGSCYAAGGRDSEAVGAWKLSLVTQSDAPFIFTLLGDALLRQRDVNQALEVLNEAAGMWPENEEVQVRIGAAYALSGRRADALQKFEAFLDKHPEDQERLFAGLKMLYEARSEGKPIRSAAEDRALFTKWADAYAVTKGPQQPLVDKWKRSMR